MKPSTIYLRIALKITPVRRALMRLGGAGAAAVALVLSALALLASAAASTADPESADAGPAACGARSP